MAFSLVCSPTASSVCRVVAVDDGTASVIRCSRSFGLFLDTDCGSLSVYNAGCDRSSAGGSEKPVRPPSRSRLLLPTGHRRRRRAALSTDAKPHKLLDRGRTDAVRPCRRDLEVLVGPLSHDRWLSCGGAASQPSLRETKRLAPFAINESSLLRSRQCLQRSCRRVRQALGSSSRRPLRRQNPYPVR